MNNKPERAFDLCPKCGKKGCRTEVSSNSELVLIVCSNETCGHLLATALF